MGARRANLGYHLHNMIAAKAGIATPYIIFKSEDGITLCYGTTKPADSSTGYAEGCIMIVVNGSGGATLYVNEGSPTVSDFNLIITEDNISAQVAALITAANANTLVDTGFPPYGIAGGSGPSPLIWSGAPILDIMLDPSKGFHVFEDFLTPDVYATGVLNGGLLFTQQNGAGTVAADLTLAAGILTMDTGTTAADDGPSVQFPGMQVLPAPGTTIYFEARVKVDMDDGDTIIGLSDSASVSSLLGVGTIVTDKDMAVFFRDDGVTDAKMGAQTCDGTNTDTADDTLADVDITAYETYGIVITGDGGTAGDNVKFYHKGVLVKTNTTLNTIPDKVMCPIFQVQAHAAGQDLMLIDWFRLLVFHDTDGTVRV